MERFTDAVCQAVKWLKSSVVTVVYLFATTLSLDE